MQIGITNKKCFKPSAASRTASFLVLGIPFILMVVLTFFLKDEILTDQDQFVFNIWMGILAGVFVLITFFLWIKLSKQLCIDQEKFTYSSLIKKRSIDLAAIKGYRIGYSESKIKFYRKKEAGKGFISTFHSKPLKEWVVAHLQDLNAIDYKEEEQEILQDKNLGVTEKKRKQKLEKARTNAYAIGAIPAILMVLSVFFAVPYRLVFFVALGSCLWIFLALIYYNGLLRMEWKTARASVTSSIVVIGISTMFGALDTGDLQPTSLFLQASIATVIMTILYIVFIVGTSNYAFKKIWMTLLSFFILLLSFVKAVNTVLDTSDPVFYETTVVEAIAERNQNRKISYFSYSLKLANWKTEGSKPIDIDISTATYNKIKVGDRITITERKGALGDDWYTAQFNGEDIIKFDMDYQSFFSE